MSEMITDEKASISEATILEKLIEILEQFSIQNYDNFTSEIDSFAFVELVIDIEDAFGIVINPEELVMDVFCNISYITEYVSMRIADES